VNDVPVLVCTEGTLNGTTVAVPEGGLTFGRASENDVVLSEDDGVSRSHARMLYDNGSLWLQDAGSRNGVFVNDVRVTGHQALRVGDVIRIGGHRFELRWNEGDDESGIHEIPAGVRKWWWPFGGS